MHRDVATLSANGAGNAELRKHLVSLGANVTVLTGLLVYFGWKRAETQSRVLGVDVSIFGMSTVDYVLRSVDALFVPIGVGAFAGLGWIWIDGRIRHRLAVDAAWPALRRTTRVLALAWLLLPVTVYGLGRLWPRFGLFGFPLSFGGGVLLSAYAIDLRASLADVPHRVERSTGQSELAKTLVGIIVVLSLFWAVTNYATFRGVRLAVELMEGVDELPSVVVYSPARLAIDAPGVSEQRVAPEDGDAEIAAPDTDGDAPTQPAPAGLYRYDGLRLLDRIGERVFLLSDGFERRHGVVVALPDDGSVRFEFVRDRR
ncbi:hypothetical protein [Egicoccus sp. AB-alg6-2]|uniref:hypothetical protein n=1 Tax=Egicoccus sp. AB-alg6-2 TaxID=3242692 RepID=UPI00359DB2A0